MTFKGSTQEAIIFIDRQVKKSEVKINFRELIKKPLPPFWRNFISNHFLDPKRKNKRYTFARDKIKTDKEFRKFFERIMSEKTHIITECLETYKKHFEKEYLSQTKKMQEAISNIREFTTCFSLFLANEWGINLSFFSTVYRNIAINLVNTLYPLLIGLYICKQRNQELSVILHKLEGTNLELNELGIPKELQLDYSKAWKILKKITKSQDIISLTEVLNYFYYSIYVSIDEKHQKKIKVKDVDLSKIILYCIAKAQISQQNVHCIVNLVFDFVHGLVSEKDFCVINLIHSIFSWIKISVKVERENDFKRYHKRTVERSASGSLASQGSSGPIPMNSRDSKTKGRSSLESDKGDSDQEDYEVPLSSSYTEGVIVPQNIIPKALKKSVSVRVKKPTRKLPLKTRPNKPPIYKKKTPGDYQRRFQRSQK